MLLHPGDRTPGIVDPGSPVEWGHDDNAGLSLLWLGLEGLIGATWADATGHGRNGGIVGSPVWAATPQVQSGVRFDGSTGKAFRFTYPASFSVTYPFTFAATVQPASLAAAGEVCGWASSASANPRMSLSYATTGAASANSESNAGGGVAATSATGLVTTTRPARLVGVWAASNSRRVYVNGGNRANNTSNVGAATVTRFTVGQFDRPTPALAVNGVVWDVRVHVGFAADDDWAARDFEFSLDPATDPRLRRWSGSTWFVGAGGSGDITGTASGTLDLTGSASGTALVQGTASGSLDLTGTAAATVLVQGTAAGTLDLTGSATGVIGSAVGGSASGTIDLTGSATGTVVVAGVAAGVIDLTGSATGAVLVQGSAAGSLTLTGSATGAVRDPTALGPAEQSYRVPRLTRVYAVAPLDRRALRVPALARRYRVPEEDSPVNVGFHTRSAGDDYPLEIDFTLVDVFQGSGNGVVAAQVTSSPAGLTVTADADISTANVARFNVSGGTGGQTYTVSVTAENAAGRQVRRELTVHTEG